MALLRALLHRPRGLGRSYYLPDPLSSPPLLSPPYLSPFPEPQGLRLQLREPRGLPDGPSSSPQSARLQGRPGAPTAVPPRQGKPACLLGLFGEEAPLEGTPCLFRREQVFLGKDQGSLRPSGRWWTLSSVLEGSGGGAPGALWTAGRLHFSA